MSTSFRDGEPYWFEVSAPDVPVAARFYENLFGWTTRDLGEAAGGYTVAAVAGRQVAALTPCLEHTHPWWNVYFKVADARGTARAVRGHGGELLTEPMDVFDQCTIAVCQAPDGAIFGISQPKEHQGAQVWGTPGAPAGVTLLAESPQAVDFYRDVFGWEVGESAVGSALSVPGADRAFGNLHVFGADGPQGVRPSWLAIFASHDVDGFAQRARELGCTVPVGPMDLEGVGRTAFIVDPNGAGFTVASG